MPVAPIPYSSSVPAATCSFAAVQALITIPGGNCMPANMPTAHCNCTITSVLTVKRYVTCYQTIFDPNNEPGLCKKR